MEEDHDNVIPIRKPELDYGEGKTRQQDSDDAMWVCAYGCLAFALFVALVIVAVVIWR